MSMVGTAMDENEAKLRLQAGGFLIALDVPPGLQLGIDCKIYQVSLHCCFDSTEAHTAQYRIKTCVLLFTHTHQNRLGQTLKASR
jgi:hypothetical protein